MDWPLTLSKHPQPILEDETPLLVLAFIEKAGIITEDDLDDSLSKLTPGLKSVLVKLHLNELIEYGSNSVRATFRGHQVLGQFGISSEILRAVLDDCDVSLSDRRHYALIFDAYRRSSHRLYQNSLCSLRQWRFFSESLPVKVTDSAKKGIRQAGLSLILRDVINWLVHSNAASTALDTSELNDAASTIKSLWTSVSAEEQPRSERSLHKRYLRALYRPDEHLIWDKEHSPAADTIEPYLYCYHAFQARHEPDEWFVRWSEDVDLPQSRRFRLLTNYLKRLQESLHIERIDEDLHSSLWWSYSRNWDPSRFTSFDTENLLTQLLCSPSLGEMAKRTGVSEEVLPRVIREIRSACNRLVPEEAAEQGGADQPATAVVSKPVGKGKPNKESEGRSR